MPNDRPVYNDLIGDIVKRHEKEGGMTNLQGAGKPLPADYFKGDTFQHFQKIARDAGYRPYWLQLQLEIRTALTNMSTLYTEQKKEQFLERLEQVNEKIRQHNRHCPPKMLKGVVTWRNYEEMKQYW